MFGSVPRTVFSRRKFGLNLFHVISITVEIRQRRCRKACLLCERVVAGSKMDSSIFPLYGVVIVALFKKKNRNCFYLFFVSYLKPSIRIFSEQDRLHISTPFYNSYNIE